MSREDPFSGTWKFNPQKSNFDPSHRPLCRTMFWERDSEGYRMTAEGMKSDGKIVKERPQRFILDGKEHAVPDAAGLTAISTRPDSNTIEVEAKKGDRVVGKASYEVSADGTTLPAIVSGSRSAPSWSAMSNKTE